MKPDEEGIYLGEAEEVYHSDKVYETPALSASLCKLLIDATPRHAFHASERLNPSFIRKDTDRFDRGKVAHAWTLRSDAAVREIMADSWRTKAAQAERDAARAAGQIPCLTEDYAELKEMVAAQREQLEALECGNPFTGGEPEVVIRWLEEFVWHGKVYNVRCRARLDYLRTDIDNAFDFKSTEASARPEEWTRRTMWAIGSPYQACHYRAGLRRLTQLGILAMNDPDFVFIVGESKPPYCLSAITVPSDIRKFSTDKTAEEKWREALVLWSQCLESGEWPGYPTNIYCAESPHPRGARPEPSTAGASPHLESQDAPDEAYTPIQFKGGKNGR